MNKYGNCAHHAAAVRAIRIADADHVGPDISAHRRGAILVGQDRDRGLLEHIVPAGAHRHAPAAVTGEWCM